MEARSSSQTRLSNCGSSRHADMTKATGLGQPSQALPSTETVGAAADVEDRQAYEETHVHRVYDQIASHFSATRYKPWPIVHEFLLGLSPGSVGVDVGCGNGKYLNVNPNICIVGSDRCENLVKLARESSATQDVVIADILSPPHEPHRFDFAVSIAVIHHMSSHERRVEAVASILQLLKLSSGSRALLYVWALEQKHSRRGWDKDSQQDVLVPWVLTKQFKSQETHPGPSVGALPPGAERPFLRYYHLYHKGELESDVEAAGGTVINSGYEKDNWWAIVECKRLPVG